MVGKKLKAIVYKSNLLLYKNCASYISTTVPLTHYYIDSGLFHSISKKCML